MRTASPRLSLQLFLCTRICQVSGTRAKKGGLAPALPLRACTPSLRRTGGECGCGQPLPVFRSSFFLCTRICQVSGTRAKKGGLAPALPLRACTPSLRCAGDERGCGQNSDSILSLFCFTGTSPHASLLAAALPLPPAQQAECPMCKAMQYAAESPAAYYMILKTCKIKLRSCRKNWNGQRHFRTPHLRPDAVFVLSGTVLSS